MCFNGYKTLFDHLKLSFNSVNTVFMCKICVKYQYVSRAVHAYVHAFRKPSGCALIGACALIRINTISCLHQNYWVANYILLLVGTESARMVVPEPTGDGRGSPDKVYTV